MKEWQDAMTDRANKPEEIALWFKACEENEPGAIKAVWCPPTDSVGGVGVEVAMTAQELYRFWRLEYADDLRGDWPIRFADYCLSAANTRIAELERSLEKYGAHRFHCPVIAGAVACSCGLDAAKEASVALSYTRPNKAEGK